MTYSHSILPRHGLISRDSPVFSQINTRERGEISAKKITDIRNLNSPKSKISSPAEFYKSLPPITKGYLTACVVATAAFQLGIYHPAHIALVYELVFLNFQVRRLFTNFFFLGKFSMNFGIRLLMIARYGVQLEKGPFETRTVDFLWMMIFGALSLLALSANPMLSSQI